MLSKPVAIGFTVICIAHMAAAWTGDEHQYIGAWAFNRACNNARVVFGQATDPSVLQRLDVACTLTTINSSQPESTFAYQALIGEWCALAADHTRTPEQLTSVQLGDIAVDNLLFARIAIENYRHFHPASVTSWRTEHRKSLQSAEAAAAHVGIEMVDGFEAALAVEAFAQHYLQDSFAAGHMGFNRVASSNAAALAYHDRWSRKGRCVANERGDVWFTYGDNYFRWSQQSREHVIETATESFEDVLMAFILGHAEPARFQSVWAGMPAFFDESAASEQQCAKATSWESLRTVSRPAEAALTYELSSVRDSAIYRPAARALVVGASRDLGPIPFGYRAIQTRAFVGLGRTTRQIGNHALIFDMGYVAHVATSLRGTITHELGFGYMLYYMPKNSDYRTYRSDSIRMLYAANLELGTLFVRFQTGAALSYGQLGPHISIGIGTVRRSAK